MNLKPIVKVDLDRMNSLRRATASFCHIFLCIEYWISPDGRVRAWMKANTRVAVFMAVPTFLAFPVVTVALWEFEAWVNALTTIASKLIVLPVLVLLALVSISIVLKIISVFKR